MTGTTVTGCNITSCMRLVYFAGECKAAILMHRNVTPSGQQLYYFSYLNQVYTYTYPHLHYKQLQKPLLHDQFPAHRLQHIQANPKMSYISKVLAMFIYSILDEPCSFTSITAGRCFVKRIEREIEAIKVQFVELKSAICVALNNAGIGMQMLLNKVRRFPVQLEGPEATESATFDHMFSLWDYMHPDIYAFLIKEFSLLSPIPMLAAYQARLKSFQDRTPTEVFGLIYTREGQIFTIPPGYTIETLLVSLKLTCYPDLGRLQHLRTNQNAHPCAVIIMDITTISNESAIVRMLMPEVSIYKCKQLINVC